MFSNQEDQSIYNALKARLEGNLDHFVSELQTIRAGRANPRLLDKIMARANGIAEEMTTGPADDDDVVGQDVAPVEGDL